MSLAHQEEGLLQLLRVFYQQFREAKNETQNPVQEVAGRIPIFTRFSTASSVGAASGGCEVWPREEGMEALRLPKLFFIRRQPNEEGWTLLPDRHLKFNPSGKSSRRCWLFHPGQQESESGRQNRYRNRAGHVGFLPVNFNIQPTTKPQSHMKQNLPIDGFKMVRFNDDDDPYLCDEDDYMCLIRVSDSKISLAARVRACSEIEYRKPVNPPLETTAALPLQLPNGTQYEALDDPVDDRGRTHLYLLCESRDRDDWARSLQQVKELLASKADVSCRTTNGSTPLIAAAHKGNFELVSHLLESRANPNLKSQGGHAAVHHASWKGDRRVFELLYRHPEALRATNQPLTAGPVLDKCRDKCSADCHVGPEECWNYLMWEYQQKHELAQVLIASICAGNVDNVRQRLNSENVNWPVDQRTGSTALHVAALVGQQAVGRQLLLELRASPDVERLDGCTPLHVSALHAHRELVQLLLEHGANPNAQSLTLECAVHLASYSGAAEAFELLYSKTAENRRRPLHSMHTACIEDAASGPKCTCWDCERWKEEVWKVQFAGLACRDAEGFHVCKHRLLFQRQRSEAQDKLHLQAEVESLRAQLAAISVAAEAGASQAVRKRARGAAVPDDVVSGSHCLALSTAAEACRDGQEDGVEGSEMGGDEEWNLECASGEDDEGLECMLSFQSQSQERLFEDVSESQMGDTLFQVDDTEFQHL